MFKLEIYEKETTKTARIIGTFNFSQLRDDYNRMVSIANRMESAGFGIIAFWVDSKSIDLSLNFDEQKLSL